MRDEIARYWGYSSEFLAQAAPELAVSRGGQVDGKASVAEVDGRTAGFTVLALADPRELAAVFVEPRIIGKRIGQALLRHALERARSGGVENVLIESDPER